MAICGACGRDVPGEFPFCPYCRTPLAVSPVAAERQRRVVTVLFCDLVGSTAAAEGADVEDVEQRLTAYHQLVRERIEAFGGVVEKFVGDAVMAVFGAPVAHEDDAERAVRAGLSVVEVIDDLADLHVRIGINTGEALVALDARPEAGESFVVGDTVNTAARLQSAAPTDAVVVSDATYRLTDRVFEYAELESFTARGKAEPVARWQALAAKSRFGTDLMRNMSTPMVGRSVELATLVNAFARADAGQLQLVTVIGEAGVGKSRLVAELFAFIDRQPILVTWRQGRCLPYGNGIAFWAVAEIVKAHLGIYDGDTDEDVRRKLEGLANRGLSSWVIASLTALLGLPGAEAGERGATFDAWRQFFDVMTEDQPAVVVVEDLHWADPQLLDFLEHLADWPGSSRLLLVATARPELLTNRATWTAGLANAATVRLTPLSAADTEQLLATISEAELPQRVRSQVVERSGGNPLYTEELIRMLRDRSVDGTHDGSDLEAGLASLPETVQALIAARIDTLSSDERDLLHTAAVVGKVFWSGAIASLLHQSSSAVDDTLRRLARRDMVRPMRQSTVLGDTEWAFTHVLIRDVAYQQQLRETRAARHLQAAEWLIATNGDRVRDVSEILVHHTSVAVELAAAIGDEALATRARPLLRRSLSWAARHLRGLDQSRAMSYADRSIELLDRDVDPAEAAEVLEAWVDVAVQLRPLGEVGAVTERALVARRASGDGQRLVLSLVASATWARNGHDIEAAQRYEDELTALLPSIPPGSARTLALGEFAMRAIFAADLERAMSLSRDAVAEAVAAGEPTDEVAAEAWITAHNAQGLATFRGGDAAGVSSLQEAIRVAERWYPHRAIYIGNNVATSLAAIDGLVVGLAEYERVIDLCRQRGLAHSAVWIESAALVFRVMAGQLDDVFDRTPDLAAELTDRGSLVAVESLAALASAAAELGRSTEVDPLLDPLVAAALPPDKDVDTRTIVTTGAADHLIAMGDPAQALRVLVAGMSEGTDAYELMPRTGRLARAAREVGADSVLARLLAGVPDSIAMGHAGRLLVRAHLADVDGDVHPAGRLFLDAARAYAELGADLEAAYARLGAGEATARAGPMPEGMRAEVEASLAAFEAMGAVTAAERAQRVLAT